ncbi:MAG: polysaccharide biosynthesis tyrosine autokinase [Pleurocapsa sp. SU_5_0]|nr:polysaccharide biosynthesis tyrosine autokinase [Pleurocapsa sp. SU_5_0]NJR44893.1 polysaccharide biosynthesis tyrosine autokinase [Hyellaceae cyanobacterium CSU_1_1]
MIPTIVHSTHEEHIDFQKYWLVLKRRWLPATMIFTGVTGLFVLSALSKPSSYQAEAQLLIRIDKSSQLVGLEEERGQIEVIGKDSNPVVTEAEILRSRPILEKAIKQLNLKNDQGNFLKYQEILANLEVKPIVGTDVLQVFYQDTDPERAASIVNEVIDLYVQEDTLSNRAAPASAREFIKAQLPKVELTVAKAEENLRRFKTKNKIANLSQEATNNINATKSLESEIDAVRANLKDVNGRFEQLRSQLNLSWEEAVAISSLSQSAVPQLISELQQVRIDLIEQRDRFSDNAPQVNSLVKREVQLETLLENQIEQIQGGKQLGSLKSKLLSISDGKSEREMVAEYANLGVERSGLLGKLAELESNLQVRQQNLESLPLLEKQQRELERRVEATQSTYQTLLGQLQDTQVAENQNVGNVRIIADAVIPEKPTSSTQKKLIALIGSAMGALLATAFAFLLDFKDRSIKNSKEAEEIFGYPLQGVIPDSGYSAQTNVSREMQELSFATSRDNNSSLSIPDSNLAAVRYYEAYNMLQANLKFLTTNWDRKAIAVTSSVPQEGKSEVASNLAKSMAELGRRVLVIDADLRRPTQHHILGLSNSAGLSNVLLNETEWQEAVQRLMPNLDVLTAGVIPDNPLPLLRLQRMRTLINSLSNTYDCIILDTPPLTGVADTTIIGSVVDGLLLVVRPGVADYDSAIAVKKLLANTEQHVLGIVANGVNLKNEPYTKNYVEQY